VTETPASRLHDPEANIRAGSRSRDASALQSTNERYLIVAFTVTTDVPERVGP